MTPISEDLYFTDGRLSCAINLKEVEVKFNNAVDKTTAETLSNYKYTTTAGHAVLGSAELQGDGKNVVLIFSSRADQQEAGTVEVKNVKDSIGTVVTTTSKDVKFFDATVPTKTVTLDGTSPTASGYVFAATTTNPETITITVSEKLDLADGAAVTGFVTSAGPVGTAVYHKNTDTIVLTSSADADWTSATTVSYNRVAGNVEDVACNELATVTGATLN